MKSVENYVVYDGVDLCFDYFQEKDKAMKFLKKILEEAYDGEYAEGVENSFMAEIVCRIVAKRNVDKLDMDIVDATK